MTTPSPKTDAAKDRAGVTHYEKALPKDLAAICKKLRTEINATLPKTTCKVWHGHPVWFVGESPVVGYSPKVKKGISLLFWNGQSFKEPKLQTIGKFKAAELLFQDVKDINSSLLRKLLRKAGKEIWDYR